MLRLAKFQYLAPPSAEEACSLLKEHEGKIRIMAGGTDLLPSIKQRLSTPDYVLDLKQIPDLNKIENGSDKEIRIGSLATLTILNESPVVKKYFPALSEAAGLVGAHQIRNMGTIGGNILLETRCSYFNQSASWRKSIRGCIKTGGEVCHVVKGGKRCYAYFAADTVPILVALRARIAVKDPAGERRYALNQIYTQNGETPNILRPTDVLTEIVLPLPEKGSGGSYKKLRVRKAISFPLAGVAVYVVMEGETCKEAKIVLGAVGSGPIEVTEAENLLVGNPMTEEAIEEAGNIARKAAQPVANAARTPGYRRTMIGVFAKIALKEAIHRAVPE